MPDEEIPDDPIDVTGDGSFPASDPPAWTGMHAGPPCGHEHCAAKDAHGTPPVPGNDVLH